MYFSEVFQIIDRFGIPPPQLYSYVFTIQQPLGFRDEKWNSHFYTPLDISERNNVAIFIRNKELQSLREEGPACAHYSKIPFFAPKLKILKLWIFAGQNIGWVDFYQ